MSCDVHYSFIFNQWSWVWFDSVRMIKTHIFKEVWSWILYE